MTPVLLETPFDRSHRKLEASTTRDELHKLDDGCQRFDPDPSNVQSEDLQTKYDIPC